jgi:transposase
VRLLKAGFLKSVFHSGDALRSLRKIVSGYEDVIKAGVRLKNQRSALFRAVGLSKKESVLNDPSQAFVLEGLDRGIESYEKERIRYEEEFKALYKQQQAIRNLESVPGIGIISAVKVLAMVVDVKRFKDKGRFLSYCGLVKHEKMSGGKSYGQRSPRYCRVLKSVFRISALSVTFHSGPMKDYYLSLIQNHGYADYNARNRIARRIAILCYGVLKSGKKLNLEKLKCNSKA